MTVISLVDHPSPKQFQQVVLDQKGTAEDSHDFEYGPSQMEVVFDNRDKAIGDDGNMNLYPYCVFGISPETLDSEMLLDPFEEKFHLPPVAVEKRNVLGGKVDVVCVVDKGTSEVCRIVNDSTDFGRVVAGIAFPSEADSLVKEDAVIPLKQFLPIDNLIAMTSFLLNDEECAAEVDSEEP